MEMFLQWYEKPLPINCIDICKNHAKWSLHINNSQILMKIVGPTAYKKPLKHVIQAMKREISLVQVFRGML